jgi:hypothetical protein
MKKYKEAGFKDDLAIASEHVKFLAANSGTDAVEKLSNRLTSVETELNEAAKLARNAGTIASTA